ILLLAVLLLLSSIMIGPQIALADEEPPEEPEVEIPDLDFENKRLVLASDDFSIEINGGGQIPYYHFNTTAEEAKFFLKLQRIVQYKDSNGNNRFDEDELVGDTSSQLQLTSVDWDLNIITESPTAVDFAFIASQIRNPLFSGVEIELVNHFTAGSTAIKFDINITNWPFVAEATGLSLEFELLWSTPNEGPEDEESSLSSKLIKEVTNDGIYLKTADNIILVYFESLSKVKVDGVDVENGAHLNDTAAVNAPKLNIYIDYPRFSNNLYHDPMFGTTQDAIPPLNPSAIVLWLQENVKAGFLGITALTTLILATLLVVNRRKR
ncbi:MAG: hypothetical protein ACXAB2_14935, partial [Candidatus Hodarchaeales archaeon]